VVQQDSEKGRDFEKAVDNGARLGSMGALAGVAANPSLRGMGMGGVAGIAAGTLFAVLMRGTDVQFDVGTSIEIALTQAIAIEKEKLKP
jgi:hypothetical protein